MSPGAAEATEAVFCRVRAGAPTDTCATPVTRLPAEDTTVAALDQVPDVAGAVAVKLKVRVPPTGTEAEAKVQERSPVAPPAGEADGAPRLPPPVET